MNSQIGRLYIVATPIGDPRDITLRALDVLQSVDAVICEEQREGSTLLKKIGVEKPLICLNEHNEVEQIAQLQQRLFKGQNLALVSDCGTPVFADPGHSLIQQVSEVGIQVVPVPGPSSLMAALSILDFKIERFYFAGFLPRDRAERKKTLKYLRTLRIPIVIMDTPYRLSSVLDDLESTFSATQAITLAMDLTLPGELILRDTISNVHKRVSQRKGEFILIVH